MRCQTMPLEQSATSAFVRPRQDYQHAKKAEKVQTEQFYGSKRSNRITSGGPEVKEKRKEEMNNNTNSSTDNSSMQINNKNGEIAGTSGIPRRNFMKTPDAETQTKQRDVLRKESMETRSPKPRRKLPPAPSGSVIKTRLPGSEVVSRRSTPDNSRRSTPEKQVEKSRATPDKFAQHEKNSSTSENIHKHSEVSRRSSDGSRKTPDINRKAGDTMRRTPEHFHKPQEAVVRKNSDSSDKNSRIKKPTDTSLTLHRKVEDDSTKSKSLLGGIKYNSLPRPHPSKNHSKFYLDIEGEEYMPKKSEDGKFQSKEPTDKSPIEYGLEKLSLLTKSSKGFANGFKTNSHEPPSFEMGSAELKQTHVALYKFLPRHKDEILLEEGDPLSVSKISEDLWYDGTNLASGKSGIFPSRYAADILAGSNTCMFIVKHYFFLVLLYHSNE